MLPLQVQHAWHVLALLLLVRGQGTPRPQVQAPPGHQQDPRLLLLVQQQQLARQPPPCGEAQGGRVRGGVGGPCGREGAGGLGEAGAQGPG